MTNAFDPQDIGSISYDEFLGLVIKVVGINEAVVIQAMNPNFPIGMTISYNGSPTDFTLSHPSFGSVTYATEDLSVTRISWVGTDGSGYSMTCSVDVENRKITCEGETSDGVRIDQSIEIPGSEDSKNITPFYLNESFSFVCVDNGESGYDFNCYGQDGSWQSGLSVEMAADGGLHATLSNAATQTDSTTQYQANGDVVGSFTTEHQPNTLPSSDAYATVLQKVADQNSALDDQALEAAEIRAVAGAQGADEDWGGGRVLDASDSELGSYCWANEHGGVGHSAYIKAANHSVYRQAA